MHRIDTSTAQKDKFGAGKNGFTDGNPQTGTQSTALNASFFDTVQEEVCAVIEDEGITLDSENNGQLLEAIKSKITTAIGGLPGAPVTSVNGKTGAVQLKATDVGAVASVNGAKPDANGNVTVSIPGAPVTSVNGKTGAVQLKATDVGAVASVNGAKPDANGNVTVSIPAAPVTSVNGKTGAVQLKAQDVGVTMDNIGTNQYALSTNGIARVIGIGGIASNNNEVTVTLGRAFPSKIVAISGSFSGNGGQDSDSWWTATVINSGSFTLRSRNASGTWSFVLTGN
ncbi:DUF2505 domain-containing protein [Enterobacter hormaechei]|uniref:DUF2505 domain-containing protein n=1 Tax=Enterobacter hormaechei TaxID=158836 RepID=UPI001F18C6B0|nr:DUF2505 domain-containing protein [Enterobacter hormaechei]ELD3428687.1 hypothetical protein [Enterobacter hormaechei]MCG0490402.1 DUF2505 domain-containing protein [Enterobacter hormaechei]MCG0545562.1 DUF2505 domain-containing protein [Enterobacter hormaechei]MCG0550346.1 DUF2505 domain-containing protein [Enterobacter hormaechei]MCG0562501.1 DUF2505 domain-containing protein [Enterobacter hormaechei]